MNQPNLLTGLAALEEAIVCAQTGQACGEANPVRLESLILTWRDSRAVLLDLIEE